MKLTRYLLTFGQGVVLGLVDQLNYELANQVEDTFLVNMEGMLGLPLDLNFTMTRYPEINNKTQEIILNIDGLFVKKNIAENVPTNTEYADRAGHTQREQIYLHQSMLDSLVYNFAKSFTKDDKGFQKQMIELVPEVYLHYGRDVDCNGELSFPYETPSAPLSVDTKKGLVVGDEENGLIAKVLLYCAANSTVEKELALDMELGIHAIANFTFDNFVYWIKFDETKAVTANVSSPVVTLDYHDWIGLVTALLTDMADTFNLTHGTPKDLKDNTIVHFAAGILADTLLSPYVVDDFLFAGFRMLPDPDGPMTAQAKQAVSAFLQ